MRGYVTCPKFTTMQALFARHFFQTFVAFELFTRGHSFHICCFGNYFLIKFKICILKPRLGGDFSSYDVVTHKGHSAKANFSQHFQIGWDHSISFIPRFKRDGGRGTERPAPRRDLNLIRGSGQITTNWIIFRTLLIDNYHVANLEPNRTA